MHFLLTYQNVYNTKYTGTL